MKKYINPEIKFTLFDSESVITTSSVEPEGNYTTGMQEVIDNGGSTMKAQYDKVKIVTQFTF